MDDQRVDRTGGRSVSREQEEIKVRSVVYVIVGAFFIFAASLSLIHNPPLGVFDVSEYVLGCVVVAKGLYDFRYAGGRIK
jgi:hypothetical protein